MATEHPTRFSFTITTGAVDRNGNIADIDGWELSTYNSNPVVFFNHHWHQPPIGKTVSLDRQGDALVATIQMAPTQLGDQIGLLLADGYIRGASVGWKPLEFDLRLNERGFPTGIHSHRQELLEVSIVGIPANPETLRQAMQRDSLERDLNNPGTSQTPPVLGDIDWMAAIISDHTDPKNYTAAEKPDSRSTEPAILSALQNLNRKLRGAQ